MICLGKKLNFNPISNRYDYTLHDAGTGISKVTTSERLALSPTIGDVVFDTTQVMLMYYDGNTWVVV